MNAWSSTLTGIGGTIDGFLASGNRVDYMLRKTQEYGDIHTFAIVFSTGGSFQTSLSTDGGQFARLLGQYLAQGGASLR